MMFKKLTLGIAGLAFSTSANAGDGLYSVGAQPEDLVPLQWIVGTKAIYDDNTAPGGTLDGEESFAVQPYVGAKLTNITPQTIVDLYAEVGLMYYFDEPATTDDTTTNSRLSLDVFHQVSERISLSTRNFVSYELEPNYSYGYASSRQNQEHLYWSSDNSIDYNWTSRFTTRTGFQYSGTDYEDDDNQNRQSVSLYNQFRYRMSPQTVATATYRYSDTNADGVASDSTNQYITIGAEHRFSPNTIGRAQIGAQLRDVDNGDDSTSPYAEATIISQVNSQFMVRAFARYSVEDYDTVQTNGITTGEYDERKTLRFGASASYDISPKLQVFGGVDYIPTAFEDGRLIAGPGPVADADEDVLNAYIGLALQITETIEASCSYNYTDSDSDFAARDYDRSRISLGVSAVF